MNSLQTINKPTGPRAGVALIAAALFYAMAGSAHGADLAGLLLQKGVLTEAEVVALHTGEAESADQALADLLKAKGIISESEAATLDVAPAAPVAQGEAPAYVVKPKGSQTKSLQIGGRAQLQYDHLSGDVGGESVASANHLYARRIFLGAKAKLHEGWTAEAVLDLSRNDPDAKSAGDLLDKAKITWDFDDDHKLTGGYFKVPFGLEESTSSSKNQTIERSAPNRFFMDDIDFGSRHLGVQLSGNLGSGFSYAAMLANSSQGYGSRSTEGKAGSSSSSATNNFNTLGFWGRLQCETEAGDGDLLLGVDAGWQPENNTMVNPDATGDASTGAEVIGYTGYAQYKLDGLTLRGELFGARIETASEDANPFGAALMASYRFDNFEPVFRYAFMDADTAPVGIDEDELIRRAPKGIDLDGNTRIDSFYLGGNYYMVSDKVRAALGIEYAETDEGTSGDTAEIIGLRSQLQILF